MGAPRPCTDRLTAQPEPAPARPPRPRRFDGLTLLHKFTFEPGSGVSYCNRYLYPKLEKYMRENGRYKAVGTARAGAVQCHHTALKTKWRQHSMANARSAAPQAGGTWTRWLCWL